MKSLQLAPIGIAHTPFSHPSGMPIQPAWDETQATLEIFAPYRAGLADLTGFERIWLLFWCHQSREWTPRVVPFLDRQERGVFATRAPARPNAIGLSAVRLLGVDLARGLLTVASIDLVDGTPLLDIKPYVPRFDAYPGAAAGWLEQSKAAPLSDGRFGKDG